MDYRTRRPLTYFYIIIGKVSVYSSGLWCLVCAKHKNILRVIKRVNAEYFTFYLLRGQDLPALIISHKAITTLRFFWTEKQKKSIRRARGTLLSPQHILWASHFPIHEMFPLICHWGLPGVPWTHGKCDHMFQLCPWTGSCWHLHCPAFKIL